MRKLTALFVASTLALGAANLAHAACRQQLRAMTHSGDRFTRRVKVLYQLNDIRIQT